MSCPWLPGSNRALRSLLFISPYAERGAALPACLAASSILLAQPTGSTGTLELTHNLDVSSWEKSSLIFDDITKSTCSLFIPDKMQKQSSYQDIPRGSRRQLVWEPQPVGDEHGAERQQAQTLVQLARLLTLGESHWSPLCTNFFLHNN